MLAAIKKVGIHIVVVVFLKHSISKKDTQGLIRTTLVITTGLTN
jgi:hypothetical protein